jgi:hypothetical protein
MTRTTRRFARATVAGMFCAGALLVVTRVFAAGPALDAPLSVEAVEDASADFPGAPRLHSFAFAQWEGKWLFIGGRTNGYHSVGGGPADFMRADANGQVWVVDTTARPAHTYHVPVDALPPGFASVREQWRAAAFLSYQDGDRLYIAGGYGQNDAGQWTTYSTLSVIALPAFIDGVIHNRLPAYSVHYTHSPLVEASGGELIRIPGGNFYVVMGHVFKGSYTAFEAGSENNTADVSQTYLEEIRQIKFITAPDGSLSVKPVQTFRDPQFRRRDLNVTHMMSQQGVGIAAFGGVFTRPDQSVFTKPIFLYPGAQPATDRGFDQKMNSYDAARLLLYDRAKQVMYTTLFGGISRHYFDFQKGEFCPYPLQGAKSEATYLDGLQWSDQISTIAMTHGTATAEWVHRSMLPAYLGTNAVFIPMPAVARANPETRILSLDSLRGKRTMIGYLFGGIRAYPYRFPYDKGAIPYNAGTVPSKASDLILKVYVTVPEG